MQYSSNILMVRPANFGFNAETAGSNSFQNELSIASLEISVLAQLEFDAAVLRLKKEGINIISIEDSIDPIKPDAIFPNNWISFHSDGRVVLYPMLAENRRLERDSAALEVLGERFKVNSITDYSDSENRGIFLEGTGSIVFDHVHRKAYACLSPRTNEQLLNQLCGELRYEAIVFTALDHLHHTIYHTNVLMCMGDGFVVICLECIPSEMERKSLLDGFEQDQLEVINISKKQMDHFAGNMLGVKNDKGEILIVLSETALNSLDINQKNTLSRYGKLLPISIPTIETIGGGSARWMIVEIFLPLKSA